MVSIKGSILQDEEIPGRDQWYIARFVADDAPDFNPGRYLRTEAAGPTLRNVVFEAEVSRERVPLRSAYKNVGQRAAVRINNGPTRELTGIDLPAYCSQIQFVVNSLKERNGSLQQDCLPYCSAPFWGTLSSLSQMPDFMLDYRHCTVGFAHGISLFKDGMAFLLKYGR